ncbi:putative ABC transporter permease subunit [Paludifilum halophilum]|uniref:Uncharacterized protein n=1 Tax=Paludifilum halophilum TaxID=1642702 RepID=A0A235B434_9BACL|nr:hypothetical protein [Paludifilum halophilum]OYD06991.1 hypothetical protein CHM34_13745 [Paludifilum halophilum]
MKRGWALTWVFLKNQFNLSVMKQKYIVRREQQWQPLLAVILFLVIAVPVELMVIFFYSGIYQGLALIGEESAMLLLLVLGGHLVAFLFGFPFVINQLYFVRDAEIPLPLPVTPRQVLGARLAGVWVNEVIGALLFLLPGLIVYGVLAGRGLGFYVGAALLTAGLPLLPIALSTSASLVFMRVTNLKGYRDLLRYLASFSGVLIFIAVQLAVHSDLPDKLDDPERIQQFFAGSGGLYEWLGGWYPPAAWAAHGLIQPFFSGGWTGWTAFAVVTAGALAFMFGLAGFLYYPGLIGGDEVAKNAKKKSTSTADALSRPRSPLAAWFWKEWKVFIRTPIFLMNAVTPLIIFTVMAFLPAFGNLGAVSRDLSTHPFAAKMVVWGAAGFILFISSMNGIASSAISREGKMFAFNLSLPVSAFTRLLAKWLHAFSFSLIIIAVVLVIQWMVFPSVPAVLWTLLLGMAGSCLFNGVGLLIDLWFPYLEWETPREVMQRFVGGMGMMLIQIVLGGLLAAIVGLGFFINLPDVWIKTGVLLLLIGLNAVLFFTLRGIAEDRYRRIEV